MATGNSSGGHVKFRVTKGGFISAHGVKANLLGGRTNEKPPPRCMARRGGPRSEIFCMQFDFEHAVHVGQSSTGRYYTWAATEED